MAEREAVSVKDSVDITFGRQAFGTDPEAYERARPAYPERIFEILRERCGLRAGISAFEIGPGPGVVSQRLVDAGVAGLTAVEPDARLAAHLRKRLGGKTELRVIEAIFEEAVLPEAAFDLGVAATSFHWVDQAKGIAKVADALKPGGWWACWWNMFGTAATTDPFMRATAPLFRDVPRPHNATGRGVAFELDTEARLADLRAERRFADAQAEIFHWSVTLSADQVCDLFATYSPVAMMAPEARRRFLGSVHAVAVNEFGGTVEKPMSAVLYTARRV